MGHTSISGIFQCTPAQLDKKIREAQEQAAYQYGHDGYSGTINVLDAPGNARNLEYTEYMFHKDLRVEYWPESEMKFMGPDEKKRYKRMVALKQKHDFEKDLTLKDLVKYHIGKKIPEWKRFILNYYWRADSDILYTIQISGRKILWFGDARC